MAQLSAAPKKLSFITLTQTPSTLTRRSFWNKEQRLVTIQSITDSSLVGFHNLEARVKLQNHKVSNGRPYYPHSCRFTLEVKLPGPPCKIESITPVKQFQAFIYILGSGEK